MAGKLGSGALLLPKPPECPAMSSHFIAYIDVSVLRVRGGQIQGVARAENDLPIDVLAAKRALSS